MNKKQIVVENISHFDRKMLNEGGIFHINRIEGNKMFATYQYLDDVNTNRKNAGVNSDYNAVLDPEYIYISFDCLEPHPRDNRWVKVTQEWQKPEHKGKLETLDNENPRPVRDDMRSELVNGYGGEQYIPKLQKIDKGDNIKLIKASFTMKTGEVIPCYNLSLLGTSKSGSGMSVQTMMAHFWKGKILNYKKNTDVSIKAEGTPRNVYTYLMNMVNLAKKTPEIADFNADYIVFPESSSSFNDYIAKYLKRYVFPNATILRNGTIPKLDTWEMDFGSMILMTIKDVKEKGGMGYPTYKNYAHNQEWGEYFVYKTIMSRAVNIFEEFILGNITKKYKDSIVNDSFKAGRSTNRELWDTIEKLFNTEFSYFSKALTEKGLDVPDKDEYFLTVLWQILRGGFFRWTKGYGRNSNKLECFDKVSSVRNAVRSGKVYIHTETFKSLMDAKTSIKEFDSIQRLSIDKQFGFKPNNDDGTSQITHEHNNAKVVIVDDNYATGASLRNAAQVLMDNGFLAKNIITLTPGDMGGAGNAGKYGAAVPHQNAEADLIHKIINGRIGGTDKVDAETMMAYQEKNRKLEKPHETNSNAHRERNTMHNMWYNQKQPQQYRQAENRKLNMNDINFIISEAIKRLK